MGGGEGKERITFTADISSFPPLSPPCSMNKANSQSDKEEREKEEVVESDHRHCKTSCRTNAGSGCDHCPLTTKRGGGKGPFFFIFRLFFARLTLEEGGYVGRGRHTQKGPFLLLSLFLSLLRL